MIDKLVSRLAMAAALTLNLVARWATSSSGSRIGASSSARVIMWWHQQGCREPVGFDFLPVRCQPGYRVTEVNPHCRVQDQWPTAVKFQMAKFVGDREPLPDDGMVLVHADDPLLSLPQQDARHIPGHLLVKHDSPLALRDLIGLDRWIRDPELFQELSSSNIRPSHWWQFSVHVSASAPRPGDVLAPDHVAHGLCRIEASCREGMNSPGSVLNACAISASRYAGGAWSPSSMFATELRDILTLAASCSCVRPASSRASRIRLPSS